MAVAHVHPEPPLAGLGAVAIEHRHDGVVGVDDLAREHAGLEVLVERREQVGRGGDPVAQGLARERDAVAGEDLALAVEREVIGVLRGDDLGEQPGAGAALLDRRRGPLGRDHRALTRLTGVGEAHVLGDEQRGRLVVELFARLLADLDQARAAGRAGAALLRQRVLDPPARQQRGQRRAPMPARPWGRGGGGRGRRRLRLGLLRLHPAGELEQQLRGIELLGAPAVDVAAEQGELMAELVDELLLLAQLGEQLPAVLPQVRGIVGQRRGRQRHRSLDAHARGHGFRPTTISGLSGLR